MAFIPCLSIEMWGCSEFPLPQPPPSSPDLNHIKNCWAWLKRELAKQRHRPTTTAELEVEAKRLWKQRPQEVIDETVDTMPQRVRDVKRSRGFPIGNQMFETKGSNGTILTFFSLSVRDMKL